MNEKQITIKPLKLIKMKKTYQKVFLIVALLFTSIITNSQTQDRIWGVTLNGGNTSDDGVIYSTTTDGSDYNVEYKFNGQNDFANPESNLTYASDGNFYGISELFYENNKVTGGYALYKFDPRTNIATKLENLSGAETWITTTPDKKHLLFATNTGDVMSVGALKGYTISTNSIYTVKSFKNTAGGDYINGYNMEAMPVMIGSKLYGSCHDSQETGADRGILFSLDNIYAADPSFVILHKFDSSNNDGKWHKDITHVNLSNEDYLFWTTSSGGANGDGSLYKYKISDGTATLINSFEDTNISNNTGHRPFGGVIYNNNYLYGTTYEGGTNNGGTVYRIKTDGTDYTPIDNISESFSSTDYRKPGRGLFEASNGKIYGSARYGEDDISDIDGGMLFEVALTTSYEAATKKHDFQTQSEGTNPYFQLLETCAATSISIDWPTKASSLPTINSCEVLESDIPAITATNSCGDQFNWTTRERFPIKVSKTITLTFDDGKGNTITTQQKISINSSTPVIQVKNLDQVTGLCEVSPSASKFCSDGGGHYCYPKSDDDCDGVIVGEPTIKNTSTVPQWPLTETTVIVWTYTNDKGLSTTQEQLFTIETIDASFTVNGTILTSNQDNGVEYQWKTTVGGTQYVPWVEMTGETNRSLTITQAGKYKLELTPTTGSCGSEESEEIFISTSALGIKDLDTSFGIKVFPNPTDGLLKLERENSDNINIQLIDMTGKVILSKKTNNTRFEIDIRNQSSGIYNLIISDTNNSVSTQIIKK